MARKRPRKSRPPRKVPIGLIITAFFILCAATAAATLLILKKSKEEDRVSDKDDKGDKGEDGKGQTTWSSDPDQVKKLQTNPFVLTRSRLKIRLPQGWGRAGGSLGGREDYYFIDKTKRDPNGNDPKLYVSVARVPDGSWGNVSTDLYEYVDGVIIRELQDKGARVTPGQSETGKINGMNFIRVPADVTMRTRTDHHTLYFGAAEPFLIIVRAEALGPDYREALKLMEASVLTLQK